MKKVILSFFLFAISVLQIYAQSIITENFETGLPATAPSAETIATLSSGNWKLKGSFGKSDNGSNRLAMNTSGFAISPPIDKPLSISFVHRGSGSGKVLTVEKSINGGADWTVIGTATVSSSSTYAQSNMNVGEAGTKGVLIRFTCGSATIYMDNVQINCSNMGDEPTVQAGLHLTEIKGTSVGLKLNKGNGEGRLVVYSKADKVSWTPADGVSYSNLPSLLDDNVFGAASGNLDSLHIEGLEAGSNYCFAVFEYSGSKDACNYLTNPAGTLNVKTLEIPSITINPSAVQFGAVKTGTSAKRSMTVSARFLSPASGNILVRATGPFLVSDNSADGFSDSLSLSYDTYGLTTTTLYIQFLPAELIEYNAEMTFSGGGSSAKTLLKGIGSNTDAKVYYISPQGDDTGDGSFDRPWYNLQKAVDAVVPGDTILMRGGIYYPTMMKDGSKTTIRLNASGSVTKHLTIQNYPQENPILNFKDQPKKVSVRGILLDGNFWHIKGIHITQAGDNGIKLEGNHNVIDRCTFSYNDDTGLQIGFGHDFSDSHPGISSNDGSYCSNNLVIDCDSYFNCDADNFGSDADGFACKMHNGLNNRFIRCRAWDNADDGWDLFETDYPVYMIDCWAWGSGRASNFGWVDATGSFQGNGNGIKLGGNGTGGSSRGKHEAWNCVAFNCNKTGSVKGFDQNSHSGGEKLVNCLAFGCGYDFMFEVSSAGREYYNNVCFGSIEIASGSSETNNAMLSNSDKAWTNVIRGFGASDFVSLSEEDAKAPRGADGSLPAKFARLKSGSVLVDKGKDLNIPYASEFPDLQQAIYGSARDLGPFELQEGDIKSGLQLIMKPDAGIELKILNAWSSSEKILSLSVDRAVKISIRILNLQGQTVRMLADAGNQSANILSGNGLSGNIQSRKVFSGNVFPEIAEPGILYQIPLDVTGLPKGVYLCQVNSDVTRMIID